MNERVRNDLDELGREIKEIVGDHPVFYFRRGGNWGDSLINHGAFELFRAHGIQFKIVEPFTRFFRVAPWQQLECAVRRPYLLYSGGGAWHPMYDGREILKDLERHFRQVVVLPSSYAVPITDTKHVYYARDRFESLANAPHARFGHDLAFYYTPPEVAIEAEVGHFFRTDKEADSAPLPPDNRDISAEGRDHTDIAGFVHGIGRVRKVRTNRLHVAICGALLGREVEVFDNSYFKIRAIYESTIKENFPNVKYMGTRDSNPTSD